MIGLFLAALAWVGISPIPLLAAAIGTTEPALNLLVSILLGFPLGMVYNSHVRHHTRYRNLFFIVTGVDIALFNFGLSFYHNVIPALVIHVSTRVLGAGPLNAILTFVFNIVYLVAGYAVTESEDYDITWTMPHCVLTLKLIALSFDLWDGQKMIRGEQLSENNRKTALEAPPTLEELLGFIYFPACFLVGPIFSFRRYKDFICDQFPLDEESDILQEQALKRLAQGIIYLIAFQVGVSVFNVQYMRSDEWWERSVIYRHIYCGMWAHCALYKYISCWLLTEAACIRFGLSYASPGRWGACANIRLMRFEGATKFQHYIDSFNCNTNHFAAEYVYKRLKFLGSRQASQLATLGFLALWHGVRSGYYMTFFNEFIIIFMEKEVEGMLSSTQLYRRAWAGPARWPLYALLKMYTIVFMGWSLVPFDLKIFGKWWPIYQSLYFSGFLIFLPWAFAYKPLLKRALRNLPREERPKVN
ncbi:lysophospholipid acyltransferase 5 [Aricia agestis]|uniref:lysophospholipid acyltransferase 5 n=1 Tax=Aricia agestis TaxID=91739 RepID=UPI001C201CF3|nr:lysophospholipid acyltransferase 5 [Aricia agestis]